MVHIGHWAIDIASRVQGAMGLSWKGGPRSFCCNAECDARMSFAASSRSERPTETSSISKHSHSNRKASQIESRKAGRDLRGN